MKILCFTSSDRPVLYEKFWPTFVSYCQKMNVDCAFFPIEPDFPRSQSWNKIKLLIQLIQNNEYDVLWWVDDDMVITNDSIDIRVIINSMPDMPIIMQKDIGDSFPVNAGTIIVRKNALNILCDIWNYASQAEINGGYWEQDTITRLMMDKIYLAEWKVLQSFCRNHYTPEGLKWTPGDFIAHFTGDAIDVKLDLFKKCTGGDIGKCAYERIMGFGTMEHVYCLQVGSHVGDSPNDTLFVQDLSDKNIILIEPVPYLFEQLKENYKTKTVKNIIGLNLAVSNFNGTLKLYVPSQRNDFTQFPFWTSQLTSTKKENITKQTVYEDGTYAPIIIDEITVQCFTLNTIIDEMGIKSIENLLIDTEGHDYEILMDLNFDKIKPKRIIFEIKHMDGVLTMRGTRHQTLINHLLSYGYRIVHDNGEDDMIVEY
jgi:hypothetical protein